MVAHEEGRTSEKGSVARPEAAIMAHTKGRGTATITPGQLGMVAERARAPAIARTPVRKRDTAGLGYIAIPGGLTHSNFTRVYIPPPGSL